ncbi:MAG: hypothetical protein WBE92_14970 [Steroidobacteraceae bacterium]
MSIDRRTFIASIGGSATFALMTPSAKADALEAHLQQHLNEASAQSPAGMFPTVAEIEAQIDKAPVRRGVGNLFAARRGNVQRLASMPEKPTLVDFFKLRFMATSNHVLQSANLAMKNGMSEEIVLACLLHDVVQELIKVDHGWWGAQLFEPYVPEKTAFAIRYHQALRFYPDPANGYEYPDMYRRIFGEDYKPEPYIEATYRMVRRHKWYLEPRMVTVNDLYAFDPHVHVEVGQFLDVIGRRFRQPREGLGFDGSPVAHMWRSLSRPDSPL